MANSMLFTTTDIDVYPSLEQLQKSMISLLIHYIKYLLLKRML